jgi:hypothetical protein
MPGILSVETLCGTQEAIFGRETKKPINRRKHSVLYAGCRCARPFSATDSQGPIMEVRSQRPFGKKCQRWLTISSWVNIGGIPVVRTEPVAVGH